MTIITDLEPRPLGLVDLAAAVLGHVVRKQLERHAVHDGLQVGVDHRHLDNVVRKRVQLAISLLKFVGQLSL